MQRNFPVPQNKNNQPLLEKDLTDKIIGAAIEVHRFLGPGLLESTYESTGWTAATASILSSKPASLSK